MYVQTEIVLDQPKGMKVPITSYVSRTLRFSLDLLRGAQGWCLYLRKPGPNSRNICFCHLLTENNAGKAIFFDKPEAVVALFKKELREHPVWGDLQPQWADFLHRAEITEDDLPTELGDELNWRWFAESVGDQPAFH